jgi:hypothetical protein
VFWGQEFPQRLGKLIGTLVGTGAFALFAGLVVAGLFDAGALDSPFTEVIRSAARSRTAKPETNTLCQ